MSNVNTSWLMSLNREEPTVKFGVLPKWAQQYLLTLREHHNIQLEAFGETTRTWGKYSMTACLHAKQAYRIAGAYHCGAIRTGYDAVKKQATYEYVFVSDPVPVEPNTVVSVTTDGQACVGQLKPY